MVEGIGVIDTSSLWAAGSHVYGGSRPVSSDGEIADLLRHPSRELYSTPEQYFLSLLHNLILYDQLRTDVDVLSNENEWYRRPVQRLIEYLGSSIKIEAMPATFSDKQIMEAIAPTFIERTKKELAGGHPSAGSSQILIAASSFDAHWATQTNLTINSLSEGVGEALHELAGGGIWPQLDMVGRMAKLSALLRNLSVLARTIRYAAHIRFLHTHEKRPSAFCASPRRIELLQDYFDADQLESLQAAAKGFVDLFSILGLPKSGFDFSGLAKDLDPLPFTDLSLSVNHLAPRKALERVLELREMPEAKELRKVWGKRLWSGGKSVLTGYGQSMSNVDAGGNVTQASVIIAVDASDFRETVGHKGKERVEEESSRADIKIARELRRWVMSQFGGR